MTPAPARALWQRLEAINAVTYFAPECRRAPADLGLEGFWTGYFACRAAPLGAVAAGVVEATFFNFHPRRVRRAIPSAWSVVAPAHLVDARAMAAASALRRVLGEATADDLAEAVMPLLRAVIDAADGSGRPLFAANRAVDLPEDPMAALWQAATTLREHRGDAHVALLTSEGLDGCEALVLFAIDTGAEPELFLQSRGWSTEDWAAAVDRLRARGLLDEAGALTARGASIRVTIEERTDDLAASPYAVLPDIDPLLAALTEPARTVARAGEIIFPNPMGLPRTEVWTAS